MSILGGANGFLESKYDVLLFAYTNTDISTEEQYKKWRQEFSDIKCFGLGEELRLIKEINEKQPNATLPWKYLVIYGFSRDTERLKNAVLQHEQNDDSALWLYEGASLMMHKVWKEDDREEHLSTVLSNAVSGQEDEFNLWYNRTHIPDILTVPAYRSARRFKVIAVSGAEAQWEYLSLYRFVGSAEDMGRSLDETIQQGNFVFSDTLDLSDMASGLYTTI